MEQEKRKAIEALFEKIKENNQQPKKLVLSTEKAKALRDNFKALREIKIESQKSEEKKD